jgi:hypothetical protein
MFSLLIMLPLMTVLYIFPFESLITFSLLLTSLSLYPQFFSKTELFLSDSSDLFPILSKCLSLKSPYKPSLFLFNGFMQGVFGISLGSIQGQSFFCDELIYSRSFLDLPDGGRISLDWIENNSFFNILIIAPGLGSTSKSQSVRTVAKEAKLKGFTVVVVHGRGIMCELRVRNK